MTPNDNKPNSFLDRGTIMAMIVMLVFWIGWSKWMAYKYPPAPEVPVAVATQPAANGTAPVITPQGAAAINNGASVPGAAAASGTAESPEQYVDFEDDNLKFRLSSHGMGLHDIDVKKYKTRSNEPIILGGVNGDYPFGTNLVETGKPIEFKIDKVGDDTFVGHATVGNLQIEKTMKVIGANFSLDTTVKATGNFEGFKGLETTMSEVLAKPEATSYFSRGSREYQDWFLRHDGSKTRKVIQYKDGLQLTEKNVAIAALSTHYFSIAIVDRSDLLPTFASNTAPQAAAVAGLLVYTPISRPETFNLHYIGYAGPKSYEILDRVDENLPLVVDYGIFGPLGKPILWLLKFLYSVFGNWGFAIVGLTIVVRTIVMPFNAYSFKSMKAMQRIQPEMNRIKERYKDKPSDQKLQMNQEIMALMKTNKASPLGGCLPTLLQLPPFFALYQVLGQSIELYRQPFIFWIHDLSAADPFYVLPVLMGATMFAQQRLTPTPMDPQQAKVMMFMPLIFAAFMLQLPSGLTLYIFVSTLFGIIQQYIFLRDKSTLQSRVKEAKA